MRSAAGAAGWRVPARRQRGGQRRGGVRRWQRLAQRRRPALPEQPQHLLRRDGPLLAVGRAQVVRTVPQARGTSYMQKEYSSGIRNFSFTV